MIRFFEPDEVMVNWLIEYAGDRFVFDIGCGDGFLVERINEIKPDKSYGIDIQWDYSKPLLPIFPFNALETKLVSKCTNSLVLFCRPCHSDWFEEAIKLLPDDIKVLYIGLPKNLSVDFYVHSYEQVKHDGSSADNEQVYRVVR